MAAQAPASGAMEHRDTGGGGCDSRAFTFTVDELRLISIFRRLSPGARRGLFEAARDHADSYGCNCSHDSLPNGDCGDSA